MAKELLTTSTDIVSVMEERDQWILLKVLSFLHRPCLLAIDTNHLNRYLLLVLFDYATKIKYLIFHYLS